MSSISVDIIAVIVFCTRDGSYLGCYDHGLFLPLVSTANPSPPLLLGERGRVPSLWLRCLIPCATWVAAMLPLTLLERPFPLIYMKSVLRLFRLQSKLF